MDLAETAQLSPAPPPKPRSSFVGRGREIQQLKHVLSRTRLLTLTGPAGCGKTRLALQLADAVSATFASGVAFVDLAAVREPIIVREATAAALALSQQDVASLPLRIGGAALLIVIDNAEHLLDAVSTLVDDLLQGCPGTRVIVTSRELLNIDGEVCWQVEPLQVAPMEARAADALGAYDAVTLFCARGSEHQADFRLTAANGALVATICRRLDGIPLALELAAARIKSLGLAAISARLDDAFALLTDGRRTAVPRHRTMRGAVEWSCDLLDHNEQVLFRRLAAFAGTFELAAVESICADGDLPRQVVSNILSRLVDKSLVVVHPKPDGKVRYGQLEVIRQYGREQLAAAEERDLTARHARYYADLADEMSAEGDDFEALVDAMTAEYPNMQLALDWAARESPELEAATVQNLLWFWMLRGMLTEAARRLESALSKDVIDRLTIARLRVQASTIARAAGDYRSMSAHIERASALACETSQPSLDVSIAAAQGMLAAHRADWVAAETWFRETVRLAERLPTDIQDGALRLYGGPPTSAKYLAMARNNLAMALLQVGRAPEALTEAEQALEAAGTVFGRSIRLTSDVLDTCGRVYLALARPREARDRFLAALSHAVENANDRQAVTPLVGLGRAAAEEADYASCVLFFAAARRAARVSDTEWNGTWSYLAEPILSAERRSRTALTVDAANAAWDRGLRMDTKAALEFARGPDRPASESPLSAREREIAGLVSRGLTDKEIAHRLRISERTAEAHLAHIRRKLGLHNRAEVAVWAVSGAARAAHSHGS